MLALRVSVGNTGLVKTMRFSTSMSVREAKKLMVEKLGDNTYEDFDIFVPAKLGVRKGQWLKDSKDLKDYDLVNGDEIHFKSPMVPMKVELMDGTVKTVMTRAVSGQTGKISSNPCMLVDKNNPDKEMLLRSMKIEGTVMDAVSPAFITVELVYFNQYEEPMETSFLFRTGTASIWKFEVTTKNRRIVSKCQEKVQAMNTYDDAISEGKGAALLMQDESSTVLSIANFEPKTECKIVLEIMQPLEQDKFSTKRKMVLPLTKLVPCCGELDFHLNFWNFKSVECDSRHLVVIKEGSPHSVVLQQTVCEDELVLLMDVEKESDKLQPVIEKSGNRATVQFAFAPEFESSEAAKEIPAEVVFLIDRSGSMSGDRIEGAKNALQVLLRSITKGSRFQIVSFGSSYKSMFEESATVPYTKETFEQACSLVSEFKADFGGTEISCPLKYIAEQAVEEGFIRHVIVLTDGEFGSMDVVVKAVREAIQSKPITISTIGIGRGAERVRALADSFKGLSEEVKQENQARIETVVARMLSRLLGNPLNMVESLKVDWKNLNVKYMRPRQIEPFWSGDEVKFSAIIEDVPEDQKVDVSLNFTMKDKKKKSFETTLDFANARKGNLLQKAFFAAVAKDFASDPSKSAIENKDDLIKELVEMEIISPFTSLVAVDEEIKPMPAGALKAADKSLLMPDSAVSSTANELVEVIGSKLGLTNTEEYGLYDSESGRWLNTSQSLADQGVTNSKTLKFKKRYFCDDLNVDKSDPMQLQLIFLQSRDEVTNGSYPVTKEDILRLAPCQLQAEVGNYDPNTHTKEWFEKQNLVPAQYKGDWQKIAKEWSKQVNMNSSTARYKYVQQVRQLPTYGMTTFEVKSKQGKTVKTELLGVTRDGLYRMDADTKQVLKQYPLEHVRRWAAAKDSFTLDFGSYESDYTTVKTDKGEEISQLISGYIDILLKRRGDAAMVVIDEKDAEIATIEELGPVVAVPNVAKRLSVGAGKYKPKYEIKEEEEVGKEEVKKDEKKEETKKEEIKKEEIKKEEIKKEEIKKEEMKKDQKKEEASRPTILEKPKSKEDIMRNLILLQKFDGNWILDQQFSEVVGVEFSKLLSSVPQYLKDFKDVFATGFAIVFLQEKFSQYKVEFAMLVEKAKQYISDSGFNVEDTLEVAKKAL